MADDTATDLMQKEICLIYGALISLIDLIFTLFVYEGVNFSSGCHS